MLVIYFACHTIQLNDFNYILLDITESGRAILIFEG